MLLGGFLVFFIMFFSVHSLFKARAGSDTGLTFADEGTKAAVC